MDCDPQHYSAFHSSRSRGHTAAIDIHHFLEAHVFSDVRLTYCLFPFSYCFPDTHVFLFLILSRVFIFLNQDRTLSLTDILFSKWNLFQCHWFAVDFLFSVHQCTMLLSKAKTLLFTTVFDLTNLFLTNRDSGSLKSTLRF